MTFTPLQCVIEGKTNYLFIHSKYFNIICVQWLHRLPYIIFIGVEKYSFSQIGDIELDPN